MLDAVSSPHGSQTFFHHHRINPVARCCLLTALSTVCCGMQWGPAAPAEIPSGSAVASPSYPSTWKGGKMWKWLKKIERINKDIYAVNSIFSRYLGVTCKYPGIYRPSVCNTQDTGEYVELLDRPCSCLSIFCLTDIGKTGHWHLTSDFWH